MKEGWLRFLNETGDAETPAQQAVLRDDVASRAPEIQEALNLSFEAAFSRSDLEAYDRYWDLIRSERTLMSGTYKEGREAGREEGRQEGREEERAAILAKLVASGMSEAQAALIVNGGRTGDT
jgi:flagellar biosynthesis/type III secretory pathway protein FliH